MAESEKYTYSHFAKPADVFKHLVLCEVLSNEQPKVYLETNSACAHYQLNQTPEQEYGIYNFINKAVDYPELFNSKYYKLEKPILNENRYLGSPALAMSILNSVSDKFYFFDIEKTVLNNVVEFAEQKCLTDRIQTINQDSIIGAMELLPTLPKSTLLHIDPYNIDKPSTKGKNYLDVFLEASEKGMQCILWYEFNTLDEKKYLNDFLINKLYNKNIKNLMSVELIMDIIQKDTILTNPGILGNGILVSNLSNKSISAILEYSKSLTNLYKNSFYNGYKGGIYRKVVNLSKTQNIKQKRSKGQKL